MEFIDEAKYVDNFFFFNSIACFSLGIFERYVFEDSLVEREWGEVSIRLDGTTNKSNGKYIEGNPYRIVFLFRTTDEIYKKIEITQIITINSEEEITCFPVDKESNFSLLGNNKEFEDLSNDKNGISIWGFPFKIKYTDQKMKLKISIYLANNKIKEDEITIDLKLRYQKSWRFTFLERFKDV